MSPNAPLPPDKAEPRARRTYSCGPCKIYKMKCNLETPCRSCVSTHREADCLAHPPNPPSEAELSKIEKRRLRYSKRKSMKELETVAAVAAVPPAKPVVAMGLPLPGGGVSAPLSAVSSAPSSFSRPGGSSPGGSSSHRSDLSVLAAAVDLCPALLPSTYYYEAFADSARPVALPSELLQQSRAEIVRLGAQGIRHSVARIVRWDAEGFEYLFDAQRCLDAACLFLRWSAGADADRGGVAVFSAELVRTLCLFFAVAAFDHVLDARLSAAEACLRVSKAMLGVLDGAALGDLLHFGVWVLVTKLPGLLLNDPRAIVNNYYSFFARANDQSEFVHCISNAGDPQCTRSDQFPAVVRLWTLLRVLEPDVNALGVTGAPEHEFERLKHGVQPHAQLTGELFGKSPQGLFKIKLAIALMLFGRFEAIDNLRSLIHSYLSLYLRVEELITQACGDMYAELEAQPLSIDRVLAYADEMSIVCIRNQVCTKWLRVVRVEKPHFPTLRFAHYVLLLMCLFNWLAQLDARLCGDGTLFALVLRQWHNDLVFQVYNYVVMQAVFCVVFGRFRSPPDAAVSVDRLTLYVRALVTYGLQQIRNVEPFCLTPAICETIATVDALLAFPDAPAASPHVLCEQLRVYLKPVLWQSMTVLSFGAPEMFVAHVTQLWLFAAGLVANGSRPLYITRDVPLTTAFFDQFRTGYEPFKFLCDDVEQYLAEVVDAAETTEEMAFL